MTAISEKLVQVNKAVLSWDGLRTPETRQSGSINYNISFLMLKTAPEYAELDAIAKAQLASGQFKGVLPPGGHMPLELIADPAKYGAQYNNHLVIKAGTSRGVPTICDNNLQSLQPMVFGPMLYPGCIINVLVDSWDYNTINKGVAFGLQGIQIVDSTAPVLPVAAGMSPDDVTKAFGGQAPATAAVPAAPGSGPPAPPDNHIMLPAAGTHTYQEYIDGGWNDEKLVTAGFMQA